MFLFATDSLETCRRACVDERFCFLFLWCQERRRQRAGGAAAGGGRRRSATPRRPARPLGPAEAAAHVDGRARRSVLPLDPSHQVRFFFFQVLRIFLRTRVVEVKEFSTAPPSSGGVANYYV